LIVDIDFPQRRFCQSHVDLRTALGVLDIAKPIAVDLNEEIIISGSTARLSILPICLSLRPVEYPISLKK
jgi:hypothetical protein